MPYYRECPHCGAALDPGEVCRCDTANGARLATASALVPATIEVQASRKAMEYDMDRMITAAYLRYIEEKRARRGEGGKDEI